MTDLPRLNLIVAVTGASGALYGHAFLRALSRNVAGRSTLIVSPAGLRVHREEGGGSAQDPEAYLKEVLGRTDDSAHPHSFEIADHADIGARPASGSAPYDGMVVIPCSMKSVAGIAAGYTHSLVERSADVCLKERRPVVLVFRETPLSLIHLRNLTTVTEAGAIVVPAAPGFYQKPKTFEDLGNFIAGRVFSLFGIRHSLFPPWTGAPPEA